jgi:hypothetical protein
MGMRRGEWRDVCWGRRKDCRREREKRNGLGISSGPAKSLRGYGIDGSLGTFRDSNNSFEWIVS